MRCSSSARNSERRVKPNALDILSRTSTDALALQFSIRLRCSKDMSDIPASFSCVSTEACLLRCARMRSPTALRTSNSLARIGLSRSTSCFEFGISTDSHRGFEARRFGRARRTAPEARPCRGRRSRPAAVNCGEVKGDLRPIPFQKALRAVAAHAAGKRPGVMEPSEPPDDGIHPTRGAPPENLMAYIKSFSFYYRAISLECTAEARRTFRRPLSFLQRFSKSRRKFGPGWV